MPRRYCSVASSASQSVLQPPGWPQPHGYANGMSARGDMVFVGGMIGWDEHGRFAAGFRRADAAGAHQYRGGAGARPARGREHIVRLTWYVRDMDEYLAEPASSSAPPIARSWAGIFRRWRWSRSARLVEPEARLEIEATAVVP